MKFYKTPLTLIITAGLGLAATQQAHATCGSANCSLVTGAQESLPAAGQGNIDLSYRYIRMDKKLHGDNTVNQVLTPGINFETGAIEADSHSELRTNNELVQLDVSYGLSDRLSTDIVLPLINNRRHEHIHMDTGDFSNVDGSSGLGDVRVNFRYAVSQSLKQLLIAGAGVKAPTGDYKLRNSDGVINEPTIMPGTGSWDGQVSAFYSYQIRPHEFSLFTSGSYQLNSENDLNYRFGNTLLLNAGLNYRIDPTLLGSLQLNLRTTDHDAFNGSAVPNTGGSFVYLTPGLSLQIAETSSLYTHIQLPVYQYVNDSNLAPRFGLMVGVSHGFQ
ncbi:MAG: transporter [Gammaproteobacteria bacterium]|nr:transporter [Gammaproteobacteria bacterium]